MTSPQGPAASASRHLLAARRFEELRLGETFAGGERRVRDQDIAAFAALSGDRHPLHMDPAYAGARGLPAPLAHGPFGLAAFFGWFHELGLAADAIVALLDTHWRYLAPIHAGDVLRFEMTITRLRRTAAGDRGIVGRHVRVLNQSGAVTQQGTSSVLVAAGDGERRVGQELLTREWAEALAARLDAHAGFRAATSTWDGTIGLADAQDEAQWRIYRGRVIEAGTRSLQGSTFTLVGDELTWAQLIAGPTNDFMRRAMQGAFSVRGAPYEYLRMTKAIDLLVECARAELRQCLPT